MKKLLFVVLFFSATFASAGQNSFCRGFEAGYQAGYCYGKGICLAPLSPLCPLAPLGADNWDGGFSKGFMQGLADQN